MKRIINVVVAAIFMLMLIPLQGFAEEIMEEDNAMTEALPGEVDEEAFVEDGLVAEAIIQENEMGAVSDDLDAFVQSVDVTGAGYDSEDDASDEIADPGEAMGVPQTIASDASDISNVLEVNMEYKLSELKSVRSGCLYFYIDFTTIAAGRVKVCLENSQSPDLYRPIDMENENMAGTIIFTSATESWSSNWTSVTEGKHFLCFYYDSSLAAEADATITIKYESAGEYIGEVEPNNSYDTANALPFEGSFWGNSDSYDYFYFVLDKPDQINFEQDGCSSVYLYSEDENGNVSFLTEMNSVNDKLRLPEGKYYLKICYPKKEYSIKIGRKNEASDSAEQEDNNLSSKANLLNCNASYIGNINYYEGNGRLIGEDIDWFRFDVPEKSVIQLQTQIPRQAAGSLTATLYNSVLSELASLTTDGNPYKETDLLIADAGTYYVKIVGKDKAQTAWDYSVCLNQKKYIPVTNIILPESLHMLAGKSQILPATVLPDDASFKALKWKSDEKDVVSVDEKGVLVANSNGRTVITAEATDDSGVTGTCEVTVGYKITYKMNGGINDSGNPDTYYDEKFTLKDPTKEGYIFKGWYTDKSYGEQVEKITGEDEGDLTLYAKWEKRKADTPAKLNKTSATLQVGKTLSLKVKGTSKKIKWSSNKKSVATVNQKGKVDARKPGTAIITAKAGNYKVSRSDIFIQYKMGK